MDMWITYDFWLNDCLIEKAFNNDFYDLDLKNVKIRLASRLSTDVFNVNIVRR